VLFVAYLWFLGFFSTFPDDKTHFNMDEVPQDLNSHQGWLCLCVFRLLILPFSGCSDFSEFSRVVCERPI
jgi:hypothetical protein